MEIFWFRNDLRLADNPALAGAARRGPVIPVFIHSPEEKGTLPPGGASRWWLHRSLARLDQDLRTRGSRLIVRHGPSREVLEDLRRETGATTVHSNASPALLHEPGAILNKAGQPFQVFTPFYRQCLTDPVLSPLPAPALTPPPIWPSSLPLTPPEVFWAKGWSDLWDPGEAGAQKALAQFNSGDRAHRYLADRDRPDLPGTSCLSPHLHFGELSPRQAWHAVDSEPWRRQLVWRDFAHHLLHHFPHTVSRPLRPEFERFPWRHDPVHLRAWQTGHTGYPIVDAGMRELWATGWMHNRVRMIVASFLVKHLRLHWEEGALWFWDTLVDADLANNTLGWQWAAGCGADAAPYFRIFNPILQGKKFDPQGAYVRRWVPEVAALPDELIHEPWTAPALAASYPPPLVEHTQARQAALEAFARLRA